VPAGAMRGFGVPQAAWAYEQQIDMIAEKLGLDPLEIRRKNIVRAGDVFHSGVRMDDNGFVEVLEKAATGIGWTQTQEPSVSESSSRGRGISVTLKSTATPTSSTAEVKMNSDGSVILLCNTVEMGQGSETVLRQILAESLSLPPGKITMQRPDTNVTPFDFGTFSSRSTFHMGNAVLLAAEDLKKELLASAAVILGAEVEDLVIEERFIRVRHTPNRSVSFSQAVIGHGLSRGNLKASGLYQTRAVADKETGHMAGSSFWLEGAGAAEVDVDLQTGRVEILKYVGVTDAGKAINPTTVEQQVLGCIVMSLGGTLMERVAYNERGLVLNPNFIDYKIPTVRDLPKEMVGRFVEVPSSTGPFGAKGIAEASLMPPMSAIANAVSRATGVRIKDLPITAEKILQGLKEKGQ
jgi:CO/xanthine dehydrogenase Mo-binding subunit